MIRRTSLVRSRFHLVAIAVLLVLALAAPAALAEPKGTVNYAIHVTIAPAWFDPADNPGLITPFMIQYALHDALIKPMPSGMSTPSLAQSWSRSPDGRTYEFVLRKGVVFHNGEVMTAEDVKFSFERYRGAAAKLLKDKVEAVTIVDPLRIRFHLKEPWPDFMTFYGSPATGAAWIVPKKYVEKVGDDGFKKAPVGAGPFKFVGMNPGVDITLEAHEKFWRKVPKVKRIVLKSVPEGTTRLAMLKRGEVQIAYKMDGALGDEVKKDANLNLVYSGGIAPWWIEFLEMTNPKSPFHNPKVRLALQHAVDRKALSEAETLGASPVTGSIIPREFEYALAVDPLPYDPGKAKKLLAEAGYPNGFDAGIITPVPPYNSFAEAVGGYLGAVGVRTKVQKMERAVFFDKRRKKELTGICLCANGGFGNAVTRLETNVVSTGTYSSVKDAEIDRLFAEQAKEGDPKKRETMLKQIQQIVVDKHYFVPIYQLSWPNGVSKGMKVSGMGLIPTFYYTGPFEDIELN
jgi:peptide/nickel transport system substrate-binding protein